MDKGETDKVSKGETSLRLGNRDISLTAFTETTTEKISLGEDGQILLLVFEVSTECPRENAYQMVGMVQEERTQSQKNKLGVMCVKTLN